MVALFDKGKEEKFFLELLLAWAEHEQNRRRFNSKVRAIAKKAGISKQLISYHLNKRKLQ